jgi:hypothetical protein
MGKLNIRGLGLFLLMLGIAGAVGAEHWKTTLEEDRRSCSFGNALSGSAFFGDCPKSDDPKLLFIGAIVVGIAGVSLLILTATSSKVTESGRSSSRQDFER